MKLEILSVVDEGLGHSSYVVGLGDGTAVVIDPARFPHAQRRIAAAHRWQITWTADTHSHADYISGSGELAAEGARFLASAEAGLEVPHQPVAAGATIAMAPDVELVAIATPGHTPDHLSYLLLADGTPKALFSGGALMVGAVGRTDLLGDEHREELARSAFRSLHEHLLTLPDDLAVFPTHGAGSFCSAPAGAALTTTIGKERATNPLLRIDDKDDFVAALLSGLGTFPSYFRELPELNRRGPTVFSDIPSLERLDLDGFHQRIAAGAAVVDARPIAEFSSGHVPGSLSIELRSVFASWLGWLMPLDRPIVFVLNDETDRHELVRQCLTIGHEALEGELDGGFASWAGAGLPVERIPLVGPADVADQVLDVRQGAEWNAGHVPGAVHVELGALATAGAAVPAGPLMLMCGHGERAMTGASLLAATGRAHMSVLLGGPSDWADQSGFELEVG